MGPEEVGEAVNSELPLSSARKKDSTGSAQRGKCGVSALSSFSRRLLCSCWIGATSKSLAGQALEIRDLTLRVPRQWTPPCSEHSPKNPYPCQSEQRWRTPALQTFSESHPLIYFMGEEMGSVGGGPCSILLLPRGPWPGLYPGFVTLGS